MKRQPAVQRARRLARRESVWFCARGKDACQALAREGAPGPVVWGRQRTETLRFYDTYDWDLAGAGLTLVRRGASLMLCPAARWHTRHALARQPAPRWPDAVPAALPRGGPVAEALSPRVAARTFLAAGAVRRHVRPGTLRPAGGKPVARLSIEEYRPTPPGRRTALVLVSLSPLRRDRGALSAAARAFAAAGLRRLSAADCAGLLPLLMPVPPRGALRPRLEAAPGDPAGPTLSRLVLALLEALRREQEGVLREVDPECLHQFRVYLRRLRALLGLLRRVIPDAAAADLRETLRALARATGRLRDLDVMLLAEADYRRLVPEAVHERLAQAFVAARRLRGLERGRLARLLRSPRHAERMERLRQALAAVAAEPPSGRAAMPVGRLVRRRLRKLYRRLVRRAAAVPKAAPADALHRVRLEGKRLRYALDLSRGVLRARPAAVLTRRLQALQDALGALNDVRVQHAHLRDLLGASPATAEPEKTPGGDLARLWRGLDRRRAALERRARALLAAFCTRRTARLVAKL